MTTPSPDAPKAEWRRWARSLPRPRPGEAEAIADRIAGWWDPGRRSPGRRVVAYDALVDEIDGGPILARLVGEYGLEVALTRTPPDGDQLTLHPVGGPLERHRHGYEQPTADSPRLDPAEVAAVLCPGLAFDRRGIRLGRGGGYYDRLLAALAPEVVVIGVVSSGRLVDRLPAEPHDRPMDVVVTPDGVVEVG